MNYGSQIIGVNAGQGNHPVNPPNVNPPNDDWSSEDESTGSNHEPSPICGRSPYCSRASHCSVDQGRARIEGCKCIAAKFSRNYWSSTCQMPDVSAGRGLLESGNTTNITAIRQPGEEVPLLDDLACPCNCTYISHACCTSEFGIVHEPKSHRLGSLLPPRANLTCDLVTGGWITDTLSNATIHRDLNKDS